MSAITKRVRCKNFTNEDTLDLIRMVSQRKNVLENKQTNAVMNQEKVKVWEEIAKKYNEEHPFNKRLAEQLSSKYDNLKSQARKYAAANRQNVFATGGGPPRHSVDPILEAILEILNKKSVYGEDNKFDDDVPCNLQTDSIEVFFDNGDVDNEPGILTTIDDQETIQYMEEVHEPATNRKIELTPRQKFDGNVATKSGSIVVNSPLKSGTKSNRLQFLQKRKRGCSEVEALAEVKSQMYKEKAKLLRLECEQKEKENTYKNLQIELLKEELQEKIAGRHIRTAILTEDLEHKKLENALLRKQLNM